MTFNPNYAELLGRELHKIRIEEAAQQRLIRQATLANPSGARKIWLIFRSRWQSFWYRKPAQKPYLPVSKIPGKSTSL